MEKKTNSKGTTNVAVGISTTIGAAAGAVAGNMAAQKAYAATEAAEQQTEAEGTPEGDATQTQATQAHTEPRHEPAQAARLVSDPVLEPEPDLTSEPELIPEPEPEPESDVKVLNYETVTDDDGSRMDVAVVAVDGTPLVVADVDMDGNADLIFADLNGNSKVDDGEVADISAEGLSMQPLKQEFENNNIDDMAQTDDTDYINDADVNDYMA